MYLYIRPRTGVTKLYRHISLTLSASSVFPVTIR